MISSVIPSFNVSAMVRIVPRKNEKAAQIGSLTLNILIHLFDRRFFEAGHLGL